MTEDDHRDLLEVLDAHSGSVLLSEYAHPIYDERLKHWKQEKAERPKAEKIVKKFCGLTYSCFLVRRETIKSILMNRR
jgi:hypothetical protein